MDIPETISLLRKAHDEVVNLRRRISGMEPKAHAYDTIAILARQSDNYNGVSFGTVDVAWRLEEAVNELVAQREAENLAEPVSAEVTE